MHVTHTRPVLALFGIYGVWLSISWIAHGVSGLWPQSMLLQPGAALLLFLSTAVFFVLLCCQITTFYMLYVENAIQYKPEIRYACLLVILMISGFMIFAAHQWSIRTPFFYMLYTANLIVFANLLGTWMIKPLKREAELIIVCVVMALADLFSVIRGPTRHIVDSIQTYYQSDMTGPPPISDFLLIKIPVFGLDHLQPLFGVSDWIIVVFLSAAAAQFRINDNLTGKGLFTMIAGNRPSLYLPIAGAGLVAAISAAGILNLFLPALPVIAVLFASILLIRYPAARQLKTSDWRLITVFAGVMLTLLGMALVMAT